MNFIPHLHRLTPRTSAMLSVGLLAGSSALLWMHAASVRDMQEVGLPAALALPQIEQRMDLLKEQNEVAQLHAALRSGSAEEMLRMYVIPDSDEIDRLLSAIDVFTTVLEKDRDLFSLGTLEAGEKSDSDEGLSALPVSFEADVTEDGLKRLLGFIEISGLLTVGDVISSDDTQRLITLTERENPAAIASLEAFLATDLLAYVQDAHSYEEQLRKAFVSDYSLQVIQSVIDSPQMRNTRDGLMDLAPELQSRGLWPLRLLTVKDASFMRLPNGRTHVKMTVEAFVREE